MRIGFFSAVTMLLMLCIFFLDVNAEEGTWKAYHNCRRIFDIAVENENLWCASSGGLLVWNMMDDTYDIYPRPDGGEQFWSTSIFIDDGGTKWMGMYEQSNKGGAQGYGIGRFDGTDWETYQFGGYRDTIYDIAQDKSGDMWFATDGGVLRFNDSTWITYTEDDGLLSNNVHSIVIDDHGKKWIASTKGICVIEDEISVTYTQESMGLSTLWIEDICIDHDGIIWVLSHRDIVCYDGESWKNIRHDFPEFDCSDCLHSIAVDGNNVKWFSGTAGVMSFDGKTWKKYTSENNGLAHNDVYCGTASGNTVWFINNHDDYDTISEFDGTEWRYYELDAEQIQAPWLVDMIFIDH
ncbi:two-component regulator propeller domain-containing protein, partial [Candidatus Omnitrophota bacterium]